MSILMYVILGSATGIKILLYIYCLALKSVSGKVQVSDYPKCQSRIPEVDDHLQSVVMLGICWHLPASV